MVISPMMFSVFAAPAMPPPRPLIHPIHPGNGHVPGTGWSVHGDWIQMVPFLSHLPSGKLMPCQKSMVSRKNDGSHEQSNLCMFIIVYPRLLLFQSFLVRIFHRHDVGPLLHKRIQNSLVKPGASFVKHWVPYKPDGPSSFEGFAPRSCGT